MGSQHVDIILKNGRVLQDLTVFNGEECQAGEAFDPTEIDDIRCTGPRHEAKCRTPPKLATRRQ